MTNIKDKDKDKGKDNEDRDSDKDRDEDIKQEGEDQVVKEVDVKLSDNRSN